MPQLRVYHSLGNIVTQTRVPQLRVFIFHKHVPFVGKYSNSEKHSWAPHDRVLDVVGYVVFGIVLDVVAYVMFGIGLDVVVYVVFGILLDVVGYIVFGILLDVVGYVVFGIVLDVDVVFGMVSCLV